MDAWPATQVFLLAWIFSMEKLQSMDIKLVLTIGSYFWDE